MLHLFPTAPRAAREPRTQAKTKFSQIQQNSAKPGPRKSKEKAWISLDSFVRIERFQPLAPTPDGFFSFSSGGAFGSLDCGLAAASGGFGWAFSGSSIMGRPRLAATRLSFSNSFLRALSS